MHQGLKQRLIGAAVLLGLAALVMPVLFDNPAVPEQTEILIPPRPEPWPGPAISDAEEQTLTRAPEGPAGEAPEVAASEQGKTAAPEPPASVPIAPIQEKPVPKRENVETPRDPPPATKSGKERVGVSAWAVQLGSFSSEANAESLATKLRKNGFNAFVEKIYVGGGTVFRVRVGPELDQDKAKQVLARLKDQTSLDGILVRHP
ncbi:MAG: SPOR domain-containing protein [Gammaproteobacteria bacterium]